MVDAVRYQLTGANLDEVLALVGAEPYVIDGDGVLWVYDMLGDIRDVTAVPMHRMPRGWWLIRGPYPSQLTPFPPVLLAIYFAQVSETPIPTATPMRSAEPIEVPKAGRRAARLLNQPLDLIDNEAVMRATVADDEGVHPDEIVLRKSFTQADIEKSKETNS
jgi:hypothetical protein